MRSARVLTIVTFSVLFSVVASRARAEPAATKPATIKAGDVVEVTVADLVGTGVETTKRARVSEIGNLSLPLIGEIKAAGLTEGEFEKKISEMYSDAKLGKMNVTVKNLGPNASTRPAEEKQNAK
jgi:protein involved in polysaccharide export with SLBB domain